MVAGDVRAQAPPLHVAPPVPPPLSSVNAPAPPPRPAAAQPRTMHFQKRPAPAASPAAPARSATQARALQPAAKGGAGKDKKDAETDNTSAELQRYQIRLEPPGPELVFRLESEAALEQRMRQEAKQQNLTETVVFPEKPVLSAVDFQGRTFPEQVVFAEPSYVNHRRLLFEEKNSERYGWDLGIIQPFVSTLVFYKDVIMLPNNLVSYPLRRYETSAGQCLPGDPVPYMLYPPELTKEGLLAELGVGTALFLIFP